MQIAMRVRVLMGSSVTRRAAVIGTCFLLLPLLSLLKTDPPFCSSFFVNGHSLHVKTNSRGCKSS